MYGEGVWQMFSMNKTESRRADRKRAGNQSRERWENTKQTPLSTTAQIEIFELQSPGSFCGFEVLLT